MILVAGDHKNSGGAIAWEKLKAGASALDALEQGVRAVETNLEDWSVGVGGYPNALGYVELDAGVMDGRTRASGAVAAVRNYSHPVSIAYAVMRRLPHVLLVGDGAEHFADEIGAERGDLLTDEMKVNWEKWCKENNFSPDEGQRLMEAVFHGHDPQNNGGTTVYLGQDKAGDIAVATSTSGWAWKYPGRVGDTPIAGAGFYADNRYGAAACTGVGEIAIRTSMARMVVALMQFGKSVAEAVHDVLADVATLGDQTTGITIYAIDNDGNHAVENIPREGYGAITYTLGSEGDDDVSRRESNLFKAQVDS